MAFHVLIIEQDAHQSELYADLIREVLSEQSLAPQLDVISRLQSSVDWLSNKHYQLVLLDLESLDSNPHEGIDLLEHVRQVSPNTAVILTANQASVEQAVLAMRLGAEDFLIKPFDPAALKYAIKRGIDKQTLLRSNSDFSGFLDVMHSCQMISSALDQQKIFEVVKNYLTRELNTRHLGIFTLNADGSPAEVHTGITHDTASDELLNIAVQSCNPFQLFTEKNQTHLFISKTPMNPGLFVFQFHCANPVPFFCVCLSPKPPTNLIDFESRLRMLKSQTEVTSQTVAQYQGVQHLIFVDDATGLYNTRYLHTLLDQEISQAKKLNRSFSVLFMDIDKFKNVNDSHGHRSGTKLLQDLAELLKKYVREKDTVFRYGGDEFIAVLSPCDLLTAKTVAERIRAAVEKNDFTDVDGAPLHLTVSIGVALFPDHANTKEQVIEAADQAMYNAKRKTRNCVYLATDLETKPAAPTE